MDDGGCILDVIYAAVLKHTVYVLMQCVRFCWAFSSLCCGYILSQLSVNSYDYLPYSSGVLTGTGAIVLLLLGRSGYPEVYE